jgi:hypothetical protein
MHGMWLLAAHPSLVLNLAPPTVQGLRLASPVMQLGSSGFPEFSTGRAGTNAERQSAEAFGRVEPTGRRVRKAKEEGTSLTVQGGSLKTWSYRSPKEQLQVILHTQGRPLDADIELWCGPNNTPCKMRVYMENGALTPFSAVIETPRTPNTVAIRNVGMMEYPITASVLADDIDQPSVECTSSYAVIQGGALRTYPFDPRVSSLEVLIATDGRPLNARIELLQGPNNNKQVVDVYTEDGCDRPFFCILQTPGPGNVVRILNTAPIEFPMSVSVVPHSIDGTSAADDENWDKPVVGGMGF